jgi:hypothetical protein
LDSLREYKESLAHIKAQVSSVVASPTAPSSSSSASPAGAASGSASPEERKRKQALASAAISKKFMVRFSTAHTHALAFFFCFNNIYLDPQEWLVASGNAKQVLDLIRLDNDRSGISGQQSTHQS